MRIGSRLAGSAQGSFLPLNRGDRPQYLIHNSGYGKVSPHQRGFFYFFPFGGPLVFGLRL